MASLNQDIIVFDHDTIDIRFAVIDASNAINSTDARAWWGVATSNSSSVEFQKSSGEWDATAPTPPDGDSSEIVLAATTITVKVEHVDMLDLDQQTEYYHECVYSGTNDTNESVVVSSGKYFVSKSICTALGYR